MSRPVLMAAWLAWALASAGLLAGDMALALEAFSVGAITTFLACTLRPFGELLTL